MLYYPTVILMWKTILVILLIILAIFTLLSILVSALLFRFACKRVKTKKSKSAAKLAEVTPDSRDQIIQDGMAYLLAQPQDEVSIKSHDGLTLCGVFYPAHCKKAERTILCVHGFYSYGLHDFGAVAEFYLNNQCNMLVIDHRAHGKSEGKYRTFGVKERLDVVDWAQWLVNRDAETPIYLDGISMGCSTVLMACSMLLPKQVVGVIADCGYTSPKEIFTHVLKLWFHLPAFPVLPIAGIFCRLFAGFSIQEDTRRHIADLKLPIMFFHGADDNFVPTYMSQHNYDACSSPHKSIKITEKAGHGESYLMDRPGCEQHIQDFWRLCENLFIAA